MGFKMLQSLGWDGRGLGAAQQGRQEPIRPDAGNALSGAVEDEYERFRREKLHSLAQKFMSKRS
jgi:hypothetical protein